MARRRPITAGELLAELERDPEYVARRDRAARKLERREAESRQEQAPLLDDLRRSGWDVDDVWQLYKHKPYPRAIPILLDHLSRPYSNELREGIARALAFRGARSVWRKLAELYRAEPAPRVKDGLATAVAATTTKDVLPDLIELLRDGRNGPSRLLLLSVLSRFARDPRCEAALRELASDPDLELQIEHLLKDKARRAAKKRH